MIVAWRDHCTLPDYAEQDYHSSQREIRIGTRRAGLTFGVFVALLLISPPLGVGEFVSVILMAGLAAVAVWAQIELLGSGFARLAKRRHCGHQLR